MTLDGGPAILGLKNKQEYLLEAIEKGLPDEVLRFLLQGADVNTKGKDDDTPLHLAVGKGHKDIVKLLIAKGADVNAAGRGNEVPLYRAAQLDRKDIAELLIAEDGVAVTDGHFEISPLYVASAPRNKAKPLVRKKAELNAKTPYGETPLHYAALSGHKDVAELLLAKGAEVNAKNIFDETPLHYAARAPMPIYRSATAELLLATGADVNAKDRSYRTPLHCAARSGDIRVAEIMLAKGADVNATDNEGVSALHVALKEGHMAFAEILMKHGAQDLVGKEKRRLEEEEEYRRRRAADAAKPAYVKVIENSASSGWYNFTDLRNALSIADLQDDYSPALLSPLLTLYQTSVEVTWYGANTSDEIWAHIERFERSGARKQFEESSEIKEMSLRLIKKAASKTGSSEVLARVRSAMERGRDNYDPLLDDSSHDIATRSSFCATIDLIDRLIKA